MSMLVMVILIIGVFFLFFVFCLFCFVGFLFVCLFVYLLIALIFPPSPSNFFSLVAAHSRVIVTREEEGEYEEEGGRGDCCWCCCCCCCCRVRTVSRNAFLTLPLLPLFNASQQLCGFAMLLRLISFSAPFFFLFFFFSLLLSWRFLSSFS